MDALNSTRQKLAIDPHRYFEATAADARARTAQRQDPGGAETRVVDEPIERARLLAQTTDELCHRPHFEQVERIELYRPAPGLCRRCAECLELRARGARNRE